MQTKIYPETKLFQELVKVFARTVKTALKRKERIAVALAGGQTPSSLYKLFTSEEYKTSIDWTRIDFFLGDERDVSPMSERSNFRLTNELLFKPLGIEKSQIFRWQTEIIEVSEVAVNYEKIIKRYFDLGPGEFPVFDFMFLGMGDDGHTASLFPFTDALSEEQRIAVANRVEKFDAYRLTLTYPVINNAKNIYFVVTGEEKAAALAEVLQGEENCPKFPAQCIRPKQGKLKWFIGNTAAGMLNGKAAASK
ncbi:MAG: 6-phosphogluconolactonase [Pyrinomonadaceae bacterium]|nr:6-phosphogluconolactonase [Pyrinomonadaceae bacterium]